MRFGTQLGPYKIFEEVGKGGMAVVYRARQESIERDVAIKVILKGIAGDKAAIQRFQREAKLIARLEHPHILPVYDFDGSSEPPYIVMRYLDGGTLKDAISQGLLPHNEVVHLLRQICSALDYAHRQGIIHRDIKPSNILIDREGNAFVSDLGLARLTSNNGQNKQITESGIIMGTPDYISPEQAMGSGEIDQRSDIYALGVMLFEMLTGHLPYEASSSTLMLIHHMQSPVPSPRSFMPDLPAAVEPVLQRALAKDVNARYDTATELSAAIAEALEVSSVGVVARLREAASSGIRRREKKGDSDSQPTPAEQNKQLSVLYANLSEFIELIDEKSRDPQENRDRLWSMIDGIIAEYGGLVDKRAGDTVLALWGAKFASEDDPERAIRAALAIRRSAAALALNYLGEEPEHLAIQIAIHTGTTILKYDEHSQSYSATGQTVNLATKLETAAPADSILVSNETYQYTRGVFLVEGLDVRLRGNKEAIQAYLINGVKARAFRTAPQGLEGINTKMIGRETEFKRLIDAMEIAAEDHETQVVTVVGEAGIGKTRLLYEVEEWEEKLAGDFWYFPAQCDPQMQNQPFALLREIFAYRFELQDSDEISIIREKFERGVAGFIKHDIEAVAHRLAHLLGYIFTDSPHIQNFDAQSINLKAIEDAANFFVDVAKLIRREEGQKTLGLWLKLENIHYADERSLDFFNDFVEKHPNLPIVISYSARSSLFERRPTWGSGQDFHTRIDLNPLSKRDCRRLVKEILQKVEDIPDTLRDLIVDRSEGNPYYMEELVKMLIEERVILKGDELWAVYLDRLSKVRVPVTLTGLMQARLDGLLPEERLLLQRASVVGRIFWEDALRALAGADKANIDIHHTLVVLSDSELIEPREGTVFAGHREYVFKSYVLRDVTYESILKRQQRNYHYELALWFANLNRQNDDYASQIAAHFEIAGENLQAANYFYRSGERATHLSAHTEALAFFERAVQLIEGQVEVEARQLRVKLNNQIGGIWEEQGFYLEAEKLLMDNLLQSRALAEKNLIMDTLIQISIVIYRLGKEDTQYIDEALNLSRELHDLRGEVLAIMWYASYLLMSRKYEEAYKTTQSALKLAISIKEQALTARIHNVLGESLRYQNKFSEAILHYLEALPMYRSLNNLYGICLVTTNLGHAYVGTQDLDSAVKSYRDALLVATKLDSEFNNSIQEVFAGLSGWAADSNDSQLSLELLSVLNSHPIDAHETRQIITTSLEKLQQLMDKEIIEESFSTTKPLDWRLVVEKILKGV